MRKQSRASDAPAPCGGVLLHQRVRVTRHMRPMESAKAEMDNTHVTLREWMGEAAVTHSEAG